MIGTRESQGWMYKEIEGKSERESKNIKGGKERERHRK